jgi:SAM-dependent MidA family methyltransferase
LDRVGRDFYTAPAAHPAFGALIALQLDQIWKILGSPSPFHVVEVGAGSGILARDVMSYASNLPSEFSQALEYVGMDHANPRHPVDNAHRVRGHGLPFKDVVGCILSNELLDSFPIHRFVIQGGRVKEVYVTLQGGEPAEVLDEPSTPRIEQRLSGLGIDLPEGFQGEVNLAMEEWTEELSRALRRGFVLTFDYGHLATDIYSPQRRHGTLRCYYKHTLGSNPYHRIGQQDITAHVDFTSLMRSGEEHALATVGFTLQRHFLHNLGASMFLDSLNERHLTQRERDANRMAMLELVRPGEMGEFKVLAQAKGLDERVDLLGFTPDSPLKQSLGPGMRLPEAPLLSREHLDIMGARYPHLSMEWEALWPFLEGD